MNFNRTYFVVIISSLALFIVLIIQVNWILNAAKLKEELFNEKANLVLSKTVAAVAADEAINKKFNRFTQAQREHKIDSLFNLFMNQYGIHIKYYFEVKPLVVTYNKQNNKRGINLNFRKNNDSYQACIGADNDLELKLVFPGKEEFIMAEMGVPFIISVMLIIAVFMLFWRTMLSLMREKKISQNTADFFNNMTHEFKTPLTNIALAGKMLMKDSNITQPGKVKQYASIILEENTRLTRQIEDGLNMTSIEKGEVPLHQSAIDFHALIHEATNNMHIQLENLNGDLKLKLDAGAHIINGDKQHLINSLCNLIENSLKYTKKRPLLSVETFNNGPDLVVLFHDNGIGIEKRYHKDVFDKFFRVPTGNIHDVKGFGIGLAYVKRIIELHKGTINVESKKDGGTTFIISLPNA